MPPHQEFAIVVFKLQYERPSNAFSGMHPAAVISRLVQLE
jgi:hypothetical protein